MRLLFSESNSPFMNAACVKSCFRNDHFIFCFKRNTMAIRKPIFILLVNVVVFSLLFLFMASPGVDEEVGRFELQAHSHDHDSDSDKSHPILENSIFRVTRQGKAYDVNKNPDCWIPGCYERNNRHAYVACKKIEATEFNALGLKDVERWIGGDYVNSDSLLKDAIKHFLNAIKIDQYCAQPYANLGLVYFQLGRFDDAAKVWDQAIENDKDLTAKVSMYRGFMESFRGKGEEAKKYFAQARAADPDIDRQYLGLQPGTPAALLDLRSYGAPEENQALRDFLFYKELAPVSLGNYALLDPGTQDFFITNRYMILRKVLPPFVLRAFQRCVRSQIQNKKLKLGDGQSKRYVMYNDRCSRWVHYQLPDLVRRVIAHNARPSYTYFGGYVVDAELTPHTDRAQCEFTMSLTIEHHPHNATWLLSLGKKPLFDRDDNFVGKYPEQMPPEDEIVDADLYEGDALLFMGRHLVHFRRGKLPEGQWTNQVFLHHVQEGFTKGLGK